MKNHCISINKTLLAILIVFSLIPDIGIKFSIAGFTWTAYRLTILFAIIWIYFQGKLHFYLHTSFMQWMFFILFWLLYGTVLLLMSQYSDAHKGLLELLSIFNGFVLLYIFNVLLRDDKYRLFSVKVVYWALNFMLLVGFIEVLTGNHLAVSAYNDMNSAVSNYDNRHLATGFMYNMNDFSAMITCMSPVLIDNRFGFKRTLSLGGVLLINLINDATTCNFAIFVFILFYYLFVVGNKKRNSMILRPLFWSAFLLGCLIAISIGAGFASGSGFMGAFARQLINARSGVGSLYRRTMIYQDALHAWVASGTVGLGPAGFSRYIQMYGSLSGLVNPHSLLFEILSQYGFIIAGWFMALLLLMLIKAKRMYNTSMGIYNVQLVMVCAFVLIYLIASFAPSSFIGYAYQWVLIAITCSNLDNAIDGGKK